MKLLNVLNFVLACTVTLTINAQPDTWKRKADFPGVARTCASAVTIGNKIYAGLGFAVGSSKKDWYEYDPATDVWTKKADFPGTARGHAAELSINGKAYIGLGSGDCSTCQYDDWYEYDPIQDKWTIKAKFIGGARYSPVSFTVNGRAFVGTGGSLTGAQGYKGDMYEYDPVQDKWTKKNDIGGSPRYSAVYFVVGNKAYVCTGQDASQGGGSWNRKELFEYEPTTDTWTQKANFPGVARDFASGFSIGNYGYVGIGWPNTGENAKDFYEYNPATDSWTKRADFGAGDARNAAYTSCNGKGYFITFSYSVCDPITSVCEYPVSTQAWEYTPAIVSTGINNNTFDSKDLTVYPNPVTGNELFISSNKGFISGAQAQLINSLGQTVVVVNLMANQYKQSMDVENLPAGTYFLKILSERSTEIKKVILTH